VVFEIDKAPEEPRREFNVVFFDAGSHNTLFPTFSGAILSPAVTGTISISIVTGNGFVGENGTAVQTQTVAPVAFEGAGSRNTIYLMGLWGAIGTLGLILGI
jgi:hypothetical protein